MADAASTAASMTSGILLFPRVELPIQSGSITDCTIEKAPVWTTYTSLEFMPCLDRSSTRSTPCFTFELQVSLPIEVFHPMMDAVNVQAKKQLARAVTLLQVLQKNFCVCDIVKCVTNTQDCKIHAQMIQSIQHTFLFVGRVFLSLADFMHRRPEIRLPGLPLPISTIVQRIMVSYASWLYHISFFTNLFSSISLLDYLRVGYTWIRDADQELNAQKESGSASTSVSASASHAAGSGSALFDRPDFIQVLLIAIETRIFELDDVHTHLLAFCTTRTSSNADKNAGTGGPITSGTSTFSLRKNERRDVRSFIEHLGHMMDTQSQFVRVLKGFLLDHPHHAKQHNASSSSSSVGGELSPPGSKAACMSCLPLWLAALEIDRCRTSVLFYALIQLYTEENHQNISQAAYQNVTVAFASYAQARNPKEHPALVQGSCVYFDPPHEFKFFSFVTRFSTHIGHVKDTLERQIAKLRQLSDTNMPTITNIQVHACLDISMEQWDALARARRERIPHPGVDATFFTY